MKNPLIERSIYQTIFCKISKPINALFQRILKQKTILRESGNAGLTLANKISSITISKKIISSMIISPDQARNLNGTMLKIYRPILRSLRTILTITSSLHYGICCQQRWEQHEERCDRMDGISGSWAKLRSSLTCMHSMDVSANTQAEITGRVIHQLSIIRFQS